jgi:hypothetical protein
LICCGIKSIRYVSIAKYLEFSFRFQLSKGVEDSKLCSRDLSVDYCTMPPLKPPNFQYKLFFSRSLPVHCSEPTVSSGFVFLTVSSTTVQDGSSDDAPGASTTPNLIY